jgi:hypothetical protein
MRAIGVPVAQTPLPGRRTRWVVAAGILVQVLVPSTVLLGTSVWEWPRPARAGWQMFSATGGAQEILVELTGGRSDVREVLDYGIARLDLHIGEDVLLRLCAAEPQAVALSTGSDGVRVVCP